MVSNKRAAIASSPASLCVLARTTATAADDDLPAAQLRATTLEIDLIFPRPGETHLRVTPFPVVFAIQGARDLWPYNLLFEWTLHDSHAADPEDPDSRDGDHFLGELYATYMSKDGDDEQYTHGSVPDGDDPFYWISWSSLMAPQINITSTNYHLTWRARLPDNCTRDANDVDRPKDSYPDGPPALLGRSGDGGGPRYHQDRIPVIEGLARFQVADDAPMEVGPSSDDWCPDVESTLPLSRQREQISSTTNTLRVAGTATEDKCLFFADDADLRPEPNPCAARPPSALAAEVTQRMAEGYHCAKDKKVWPPPPEGYCFEQPDYCIPKPNETWNTCSGGPSMSMKTGAVVALLCAVGMILL